MDYDVKELKGTCHCKSVQFRVRLTNGLHTARRCSCSYCSMRGAIAVSAELDGVEILQGKESLTIYQFNTRTAKHYFCSKCGIYTHHQRRSNNSQYGVNVACLEGINPFNFAEVAVYDGVNHPVDTKKGAQILGILRFENTKSDGNGVK